MLSGRAIALQGVGYGSRVLALEGFSPVFVEAEELAQPSYYGRGGLDTETVRKKWELLEARRQIDAFDALARADAPVPPITHDVDLRPRRRPCVKVDPDVARVELGQSAVAGDAVKVDTAEVVNLELIMLAVALLDDD